MKMYSGSVPFREFVLFSGSVTLRESTYLLPPPGIHLSASPRQHALSYFPRAVLQIRSTHAIIPSEELSSTRSYPRLSSQRMHVFAL